MPRNDHEGDRDGPSCFRPHAPAQRRAAQAGEDPHGRLTLRTPAQATTTTDRMAVSSPACCRREFKLKDERQVREVWWRIVVRTAEHALEQYWGSIIDASSSTSRSSRKIGFTAQVNLIWQPRRLPKNRPARTYYLVNKQLETDEQPVSAC